jgi:hypothetical protein
VVVVAAIITVAVAVWLTAAGYSSIEAESLATLWQVEASIAGIALPLLAVVVQLAGDQGQTGARTHEVLTRHSWMFPIAVIALTGTLYVGAAEVWRPSALSVAIAYGWLVTTVVGALFAYYRCLSCLFNPSLLRRKATDLAKERMRDSFAISVSRRNANNTLVADLQRLGAVYVPYISRTDRGRWVVVQAPPDHVVQDVHLLKLSESLQDLTPADTAGVTSLDLAEPTAERPPDRVRLLRLIGQRTRLLDKDLLGVRRDAFESFDEAAFRERVEKAFRAVKRT